MSAPGQVLRGGLRTLSRSTLRAPDSPLHADLIPDRWPRPGTLARVPQVAVYLGYKAGGSAGITPDRTTGPAARAIVEAARPGRIFVADVWGSDLSYGDPFGNIVGTGDLIAPWRDQAVYPDLLLICVASPGNPFFDGVLKRLVPYVPRFPRYVVRSFILPGDPGEADAAFRRHQALATAAGIDYRYDGVISAAGGETIAGTVAAHFGFALT